MLFNFWGIVSVDSTPEGIVFASEESRIVLDQGNNLLLTPPVDDFVKFAIAGQRVVRWFSKEGTGIHHPQGEWVSRHDVLGCHQSYLLFNEEEDGQDLYVARRWNGEAMFTMPYYYAECHFAPAAMALGKDRCWTVYDLTGMKLLEMVGVDRSERRWLPRFSDRLFFFRTTEEPVYQVYDVEQRKFRDDVTVVDGLVGVFALPGGGTLLVDAEGVKLLGDADQGGGGLQMLHRFDTPMDVDGNDLMAWHDGTRVYMAFTGWLQPQVLLALALREMGDTAGPSPLQAEELRWDSTWEITNQCGVVDGRNFLTLQRKHLLAESALLVWRPDEPLTQALLEPVLSPVVRVAQAPSPKKGKHGYRIEVQDTSANRAVRSAAFELGRLLGESCSGPYNQASEIPDRKFDGQFHVSIACANEPDELERGYLTAYIKFFREWGGLSAADGRSPLANPVITWNIGAS